MFSSFESRLPLSVAGRCWLRCVLEDTGMCWVAWERKLWFSYLLPPCCPTLLQPSSSGFLISTTRKSLPVRHSSAYAISDELLGQKSAQSCVTVPSESQTRFPFGIMCSNCTLGSISLKFLLLRLCHSCKTHVV